MKHYDGDDSMFSRAEYGALLRLTEIWSMNYHEPTA